MAEAKVPHLGDTRQGSKSTPNEEHSLAAPSECDTFSLFSRFCCCFLFFCFLLQHCRTLVCGLLNDAGSSVFFFVKLYSVILPLMPSAGK